MRGPRCVVPRARLWLPSPMSTSAAGHLSPAFPERAAWGTAAKLRAWQEEALEAYLGSGAARLPRRGHPGRRQDHLRPADRHRAARPRRRAGGHRRRPHRAPQDASGPTPPAGSASSSTRRSPTPAACSRTSTTGSRSPTPQVASKPQLHRRRTEEAPDPRHPRRDPPRRRRAVVGRRHPRGLRRRDPAALAHRHAVPLRHQPDPVRALRDGRGRHPALGVRLQLRVRRGAARRRRAPGALPRLRRRDALAHQGRRRGGRPARRAAHQGPDRAGLAHRARPQGRVGALGARRRRHAAQRGAPPRAGCRWAGHRLEPDLRARLRPDPARPSPARTPPSCCPTTPGRAPASSRSRRAPRGGWSPCGWCRRGSTCRGCASGVYATSTSTPLFFAQAVGRFVRARRRGETASVFLPSVPVILSHAATMEEERDHALNRPIDRRGRGLAVGRGGGPARRGQPHREDRRARRTPRSRRWSPTPTSTTCSSTPSSSACTPPWARRRSRTTSACPGLLEPDQVDHPAQRAAGASRPRRRARAAVPPRHPGPRRSRPTGPWPRSARSSTSSSRPTRRRPAARTRASTSTCAGRAAGPSSPPPRASRCSSGWSGSGAGSSAVADRRRPPPDVHRLARRSTRAAPDAGLGSPIVTHTDTNSSPPPPADSCSPWPWSAAQASSPPPTPRPRRPPPRPGNERQAVPDHRARHHRPARQRLQLGLLQQRDLQRQPRPTTSASPRPPP